MGAKQLKLFKQLSRHDRASAASEGGLKQCVSYCSTFVSQHKVEWGPDLISITPS